MNVDADLTGHQRVERLFDILDRDAQIGGAGAIDIDVDLRLAAAQRGIGVGQSRDRLHFRQQFVGVLRELFEVGPLDVELNVRVALAVRRWRSPVRRWNEFPADIVFSSSRVRCISLLLRLRALIHIDQLHKRSARC